MGFAGYFKGSSEDLREITDAIKKGDFSPELFLVKTCNDPNSIVYYFEICPGNYSAKPQKEIKVRTANDR